jgi:hypothetical protein
MGYLGKSVACGLVRAESGRRQTKPIPGDAGMGRVLGRVGRSVLPSSFAPAASGLSEGLVVRNKANSDRGQEMASAWWRKSYGGLASRTAPAKQSQFPPGLRAGGRQPGPEVQTKPIPRRGLSCETKPIWRTCGPGSIGGSRAGRPTRSLSLRAGSTKSRRGTRGNSAKQTQSGPFGLGCGSQLGKTNPISGG